MTVCIFNNERSVLAIIAVKYMVYIIYSFYSMNVVLITLITLSSCVIVLGLDNEEKTPYAYRPISVLFIRTWNLVLDQGHIVSYKC